MSTRMRVESRSGQLKYFKSVPQKLSGALKSASCRHLNTCEVHLYCLYTCRWDEVACGLAAGDQSTAWVGGHRDATKHNRREHGNRQTQVMFSWKAFRGFIKSHL